MRPSFSPLAPSLALAALAFGVARPAAADPPTAAPASSAPAAAGASQPSGMTIETPEGFLRLEEPPAPGLPGSFSVEAARAQMAPATQPLEPAEARALAPPPAPPCREERRRFLSALLRRAGVELSDPEALLEGLYGPAFAAPLMAVSLPADPIRTASADVELRSLAEALARCTSGSR